jgi:hypothetical protein
MKDEFSNWKELRERKGRHKGRRKAHRNKARTKEGKKK